MYVCEIKSKRIIVNVISPYVIDYIVKELRSVKMILILVNGSNHEPIKLLSTIVRNFLLDVCLKNKILEFSNLPGEN